MKKIFFLIILVTSVSYLSAQNRRPVEEDKPITVDGIELGYIITEEDSRTAGKEEFSRFKITFYANNGGCSRVYRLRENNSSDLPTNLVASFYVRNANGKRMTSRDVQLTANSWYVAVKTTEKNAEGKDVEKVREMMAGYIFRVGDHLEESITALVPLGERPKVEVILHRSSDL
ncbi:MAG: hypothetical protein MUE99_00555 [Chitinophagaceae bacterium]|nr:hypothetical protein [Chitinophagaceae bacterium]